MAGMTPNEVRIGNIVLYKGEMYEIDGILTDCCSLKGYGFVEWDYISPIHLTYDVLCKLGYEDTKPFNIDTYIPGMLRISATAKIKSSNRMILIFDLFNSLEYGSYNEFIYKNKDEILKHIEPTNEAWLRKHDIVIEYVHQLQNIDYDLFKTVTTFL